MNYYFNNRLNIIKGFCFFICFAILLRLGYLQIIMGEEYRLRSESIKTRTIVSEAPRGNIVDRFGRVLAENKLSYSVMLMKSNVVAQNLNDVILATVKIIEENEDSFNDELPILVNPIRFTYEDQEQIWKTTYSIAPEAGPKEAFQSLRKLFDIPTTTPDEDAYSELSDQFKVSLPFELSSTSFTYKDRELKWKRENNIEESYTAEETLNELFKKYDIDLAKYNIEDARKILSIRYLLKQSGKNYVPLEIASNINDSTRIAVEEAKIFLDGVSVSEKSIRTYPNGNFATHVIGYMGKIGADNVKEYSDKGYSPNAVIGKDGIEYALESKLKGKDGQEILEVDNKGNLLDVIEVESAVPGDTVFLTIDNKLQAVAEESLLKTMKSIKGGKTSGGAVAIDVNTGAILALTSEPGFDLNMFATGISTEDWNSLQPKTSDVFAPKPLMNNVISYPLPPGSTMKMVTATAALAENKVTPTETYYCAGTYREVPNTAPKCSHGASHGATNIVRAIEKSCNVFFYEMGRRIGGENFQKYAESYGFGEKTGVELPNEYSGSIAGPKYKKEAQKNIMNRYLKNTVGLTEEVRNEICGFMDKGSDNKYMLKRLTELGVTDKAYRKRILEIISESKWMPGDNLNAAIGQGMNNVTLLQLVNYTGTIANGGTRYKSHIVKKTVSNDGTITEVQPEVVEKIAISPEDMKVIQKGMYEVVNGSGTAKTRFYGSKIKVAGKTGTAETGGKDIDHSWFVGYAPYDDPQIAVAVVIFQGGGGSGSIPVARDIIEAYLTPTEINDNIIVIDDIIP